MTDIDWHVRCEATILFIVRAPTQAVARERLEAALMELATRDVDMLDLEEYDVHITKVYNCNDDDH